MKMLLPISLLLASVSAPHLMAAEAKNAAAEVFPTAAELAKMSDADRHAQAGQAGAGRA